MKRNINIGLYSWVLYSTLLLIVVIFLLLRFVNLDADFPLGITQSAALYTDEGWYANAAVRHYISGNWYQAGDFNPAINMPLGYVLHRLTFSICGLGLSSVRITIAVCFILLVIVSAGLVHKQFSSFTALLTALLLATNYLGFVYSRLALMEFIATFFVFSGLLVAEHVKEGKWALGKLLFASALVGAGILTKTTMVFAVPLLAYIAWNHGRSYRMRFAFVFASVTLTLCMIGSYQIVARTLFPEDYAYFIQINFDNRMHKNLAEWFFNIPRVVESVKILGIGFIGLTGLTTAVALIISDRYRSNSLVRVVLGYIAFYIVVLSLSPYGPPRYYLPLIVPFAVLCATACVELRERLYKTRWSSSRILPVLPLIIVFGISLGGSVKVMNYLSKPSYSFLQMAQEVGRIIQDREGNVADVVLFGSMADSVATEIGIRTVNTGLGTNTLSWKLKRYRPKYLLIRSGKRVLRVVVAEGGHIMNLASWDVYGNYRGGHQVQLVHVRWD